MSERQLEVYCTAKDSDRYKGAYTVVLTIDNLNPQHVQAVVDALNAPVADALQKVFADIRMIESKPVMPAPGGVQ